MYKRIIAVIIALTAAFALAACGDSSSKSVKLDEGTPAAAEADKAAENATTPAADNKAKEADKDTEKAGAKAQDQNTGADDAEEGKETEADKEELETVEGVVAPKERLANEWTGTIAADGDGLNLRSGPDPEYEEIDLIPDDTEITIYAEEDGWGYTNYRDQYGWVFLEWVEK